MQIVYFAHSYRQRDQEVVEHFGRLLEAGGLILSLDPPSNAVNAAKLERHIGSTDGMVAVLTQREDGFSRHILFETLLCRRARKPLLVFLEDTLPDDIVPARVLQRRFSRSSFLRQLRDHQHAVRELRAYIGEAAPAYAPATWQKRCAVIGGAGLSPAGREALHVAVREAVAGRGYAVVDACEGLSQGALLPHDHLASGLCLAVQLVDSLDRDERYLMGLCDGLVVPSVRLTASPRPPSPPLQIPEDYLPRPVDLASPDALSTVLRMEVALAEEDFLELEDQEKVRRYADRLSRMAWAPGRYAHETRALFMGDVNVSNSTITNTVSGAGNQISNAANTGGDVSQANATGLGGADLAALAADLAKLRAHLLAQPTNEEAALDAPILEAAERTARQGDAGKTASYLRRLGDWTLTAATAIGTTVAAAAIKGALGIR